MRFPKFNIQSVFYGGSQYIGEKLGWKRMVKLASGKELGKTTPRSAFCTESNARLLFSRESPHAF